MGPDDIRELGAATRALGGAVLGPRELARALGFDPLAVLGPGEEAAVARIPFGTAELERARANGEFLVLRVARDPDGPLTMLRLAARLGGGLDPSVHKGSGYLLRPEWTIDDQPFAIAETCGVGWSLVRREPLPATLNRTYVEQDAALGSGPTGRRRRSAPEIAFDTLCWERAHGERLLATSWDWSRSVSTDQGYAALGEFGAAGLRVIAYSRAVRFGTLGVCAQR
jgi:hypothetical protein